MPLRGSSSVRLFRPAAGTKPVELETVIFDVERGRLLGPCGQPRESGRVEVLDATAAGAHDMVVMLTPFLVSPLRLPEVDLLHHARVP